MKLRSFFYIKPKVCYYKLWTPLSISNQINLILIASPKWAMFLCLVATKIVEGEKANLVKIVKV